MRTATTWAALLLIALARLLERARKHVVLTPAVWVSECLARVTAALERTARRLCPWL